MRETNVTNVDTSGMAELNRAFAAFASSSGRLQKEYERLQQEVSRLKDQLQKKEEVIKRSERLATLGQTAAALAHEIRNPLGAIKLFVSLLEKDVSDQSSLQIVGQIKKSVQSLTQTVDNILKFSKGSTAKKEIVHISHLIEEEILKLQALHGGKLEIELTVQCNPYLYVDENGMRQVIRNLIANSLQATRGNGHLMIKVSDGNQDHEVKLEFKDDGPGIPNEIIDEVFEPFVTSRNEGTGLGLAIVRQVIELHGGKVRAFNDKGAVFEVVLPRKVLAENKVIGY